MGINFYARENYCEHCKRGDDLHIGKSSGGWCFSLHVIPERGLNTLDDWKTFLDGERKRIPVYDEYQRPITITELLDTITARSWPKRPESYGFDYASNHAVPGPNGLVRSRVDGSHCVGHGEGTWDLITGEFS